MTIKISEYLYGKQNSNKEYIEDLFPNLNNSNTQDFTINYHSVFKYFTYIKSDLLEQGWKIHISCTKEKIQEILNVVSIFCIDNNISYKYIYNRFEASRVISGEISPLQIGKFITIYPENKKAFKNIIHCLYPLLKEYNGPYILSDKQYLNSIIYYRYGIINSNSDYLLTPEGDKILDNRDFFEIPYFETDPLSEENPDEIMEMKFLGVSVTPEKIIHSSASGNIYLAALKENNKKSVILKESRAHVLGIWGTAIDDLRNEKKIVSLLKGIEGIPNIYFDFMEWENYYVVQEHIKGTPFCEVKADVTFDHIIFNNEEVLKCIMKKVLKLVDDVHRRGIILQDISGNNLLLNYNKGSYEVSFCDFGSSYVYKNKNLSLDNIVGATEGYYDAYLKRLEPFDADYHKLGYTLMNFIFPCNRMNFMDFTGESALEQFYLYCKDKNYSSEVFRVIYLLVRQPSNWKIKLKKALEYNFFQKESEDLRQNLLESYEKHKNTILYANDLSNEFAVFSKDKSFFNVLSGLHVPLILSHIKSKKFEIPDDISIGGLENSNLSFLFDKNKKEEFYNVGNKYKNIIKNWILNCEDYTISSGLLGLGTILMVTDKQKEFSEVDEYINLIEKKVKTFDFKLEKGTKLGVLNGYLGVAYFEILLYKRFQNDTHLSNAIKIFQEVQKYIVELEDKNLYLPNEIGGGVSTPYIKDGLSGFLYIYIELFSLSKKDIHISTKFIKKCVQTLLNQKWVQYPGFIDGMAGISYVIYKYGKMTNDIEMIYSAIKLLKISDYLCINIEDYLMVPNKYHLNFTFDFESGNAGILFVYDEIIEYLNLLGKKSGDI